MKKFILFLGLLGASVSAQWNPDIETNLEVSSLQVSSSYTATTSDGKTYVVFWEENPEFNYRGRVQLLDKDGQKLFGENGIVLNTKAEFSTYTQVMDLAVDSNDDLVVVFYATGDGIGYTNKISKTGENIWGEEGIVLEPSAMLGKVLPLDSGVIIGYYKSGKGYITKLNNETGERLWEEPIVISSPEEGFNFTSVGELAKYSDDGFIVILNARKTSFQVSGGSYAQRFTKDGDTVWDNPIKILNSDYVYYNRRYNKLMDNDVFYIGISASGINGDKFDAQLQRINSDGTLPWGTNGADFSDSNYNETALTISKIDNHIWGLSTYQKVENFQAYNGEFAQKFDAETGELLFGESAKEIIPATSENNLIHTGDIGTLNNQATFILQSEIDASVKPTSLILYSLDENGKIKTNETITGSTVKSYVNFVSTDDQAVAIWSDKREGSSKLYAQNFVVENLSTNENQIVKNELKVSPNPFISELIIDSKKEIKNNIVYDLTGREVYRSSNKKMNLGHLTKGVYILKTVLIDGSTNTNKIIKK